jgi:hypothetical protein
LPALEVLKELQDAAAPPFEEPLLLNVPLPAIEGQSYLDLTDIFGV